MGGLKPVTLKEFVSRMNELGYKGPFFGGKHPKKSKGNLTITIPNRHVADIGIGFLKRLLMQFEISNDEWLNK